MAIRFQSNGDYLTRDAAYLNRAASWTRLLWLRNGATVPPPDYRNYLTDGDPAYVNPNIYIGAGASVVANTVVVDVDTGAGHVSTIEYSPADSTWVWVAAVYDSVAHTIKFYGNGTLIDTISVDLSTVTFVETTQRAGTGPGSFYDDSLAYIREWQATRTLAELVIEAASATAVITANLLSDTPISNPANLSDLSGLGHGWTLNGTLALFQAGPLPLKFGGVVGFTTDATFTTGAPLISVGNGSSAAFLGSATSTATRGIQVWSDITGITFGDGINNPVPINLYVRYSNPTPVNSVLSLGFLAGNGSSGIWYGAPPQTLELEFQFSTIAADGSVASDGWWNLYLDGILILNATGIKTNADSTAPAPVFSGVRIAPMGWCPSLYVLDEPVVCAGYGQSGSSPAPVAYASSPAFGTANPPVTNSDVCGLSTGQPVLFNENFIGVPASDVFAASGGYFHTQYGNRVDGAVVALEVGLFSGFLRMIAGGFVYGSLFLLDVEAPPLIPPCIPASIITSVT